MYKVLFLLFVLTGTAWNLGCEKSDYPVLEETIVLGKVTDVTNDKVIQNVLITIESNRDLGRFDSDEKGSYRIPISISEDGNYTLTAKRKGYKPYSTIIKLDKGQPTEHNISMNPDEEPPQVLKVNYNPPSPVKATDNFKITIQFSESLDEKIKPKIELRSSGRRNLAVPEEGSFSTTKEPNDTYTTNPIVLNTEMEGIIKVVISEAQDCAGNPMHPNTQNSFLLDTTPPPLMVFKTPPSCLTDTTPRIEWENVTDEPVNQASGFNHYEILINREPDKQPDKDDKNWRAISDKPWTVTLPLEIGVNAIWVRSVDKAGNQSEAAMLLLQIATPPPEIKEFTAKREEATITFDWEPIDEIFDINLKVSTDPSFPNDNRTTKVEKGKVDKIKGEVIANENDGISSKATYHAKISAVNECQLEGKPTVILVPRQTNIFAVYGKLSFPKDKPAPDGLTVMVGRESMDGYNYKDVEATTWISNGDVKYSLPFVDFYNERVAADKDTIRVVVKTEKGDVDVLASTGRQLTENDVAERQIEINMDIP